MTDPDIAWKDRFDHLGHPLLIVDENHKIIKANEAVADLIDQPIHPHCSRGAS